MHLSVRQDVLITNTDGRISEGNINKWLVSELCSGGANDDWLVIARAEVYGVLLKLRGLELVLWHSWPMVP